MDNAKAKTCTHGRSVCMGSRKALVEYISGGGKMATKSRGGRSPVVRSRGAQYAARVMSQIYVDSERSQIRHSGPDEARCMKMRGGSLHTIGRRR